MAERIGDQTKLLSLVATLLLTTPATAHSQSQVGAEKNEKPRGAIGRLKLTIIDRQSGKMTPARVQILSPDGASHIADDALLVGGDCYNFDDFDGTLESALAALDPVVVDPFTRVKQFYSTGYSSLEIPEGDVEFSVFKGPEYRIATGSITISADQTVHRSVTLSRLRNLPEKGWYSADDHLHIARPVKEIDPYISKMMQAEDIHVANLLQMGQADHFKVTPQYAHGPDSHYKEGNYIIATGQENPRTHLLGHSITLGAAEPLNNPDQYLIYRLLWEDAVSQGAINGYAHWGTAGNYGKALGLPLLLPHGLMHFLEVLNINQLHYERWYDILNMGFRIAPTAGTDYPCLSPPRLPGHERFYTRVTGPFTYENWLRGVRDGRTFVTTGPLLEFSVNGEEIGTEITLDDVGTVEIVGKAVMPVTATAFRARRPG